MYEIEFYEDKNGKSEIVAYFDMLEEFGTRIGEPVVKYLERSH